MILESAPLQVRPGTAAAFEAAFHEAQAIISSMPGYRSHELPQWKKLLHHFYDPFPTVNHYERVAGGPG
ncbi:MAG TPA: antibiotic biosynthesis monooxygenase [Usitatibacter sp.]|jgi:heme-degrading monooxygenase HmoA|nr:antibiotic biosynthesis monooxygenase [Usitatibacter sp.]